MKNLMIDMQNDSFGVQLAELFGISYSDLSCTSYDIHENYSNDGVLISYIIEFSENSPNEVLKKIKGLDGFKIAINPVEINTSEIDFYEYQYNAIISHKDYYSSFTHEIENLKKLSLLHLDDLELKTLLYRQIFISVFGTLETFLSDAFINLTLENDDYLRNFVETFPEFKQRKFELKDVFLSHSNIKETSYIVMRDVIYHDLPKVKNMYSSTFKIEFPELNEIIKFVSIRHDLVHRNGKSKSGEKIITDKQLIDGLIKNVKVFVDDISEKLKIISYENELPF